MDPPLIGITEGNHPQMPGLYVLRWDYIRSVEQAGGIPVVLAPSIAALHSTLVNRFDGLMLTGGVDVDPSRYGEAPHPSIQRGSKERDEFEFQLLQNAVARHILVLGICRGMHVMNVARGGSLIQDIPSCTTSQISHDDPNRPRHKVAHAVSIQARTRLHTILQCSRIEVNSFHHQTVKKLGDGLIATVQGDDGLVEGIELPGPDFYLGVQWHLEAFWEHGAPFAPLFAEFIQEASRHRRV